MTTFNEESEGNAFEYVGGPTSPTSEKMNTVTVTIPAGYEVKYDAQGVPHLVELGKDGTNPVSSSNPAPNSQPEGTTPDTQFYA